MQRRRFKPWFIAGIVLWGVGGCAPRPQRITIASGLEGGFYNRLGSQIQESAQITGGLTVENIPSQGSLQNLQNLRDRKADFAIVQLDVASDFLRQGQGKALVILANEHVHIITQANSSIKTVEDLQGKRVAIGSPGSGIHYTATGFLKALGLEVKPDPSNFDTGMQKLAQRQIDALIYVGSVGASEKLRQKFLAPTGSQFRLISVPPQLVNYLTGLHPSAYQADLISAGTYRPRPAIPPQDIATFSTATVVLTRADADKHTVGLLTWAIVSTARQYAQFYPALQTGDARSLLQKGLIYAHPAAQQVLEQGDPRDAWVRYWESNSDLQAGLVILLGTSGIGLLLQYWRRERSKKLLGTTLKRIHELKDLLPHDPQETLRGIEDLSQEHRVMFIDGVVTAEVYDEVRQKTQMFADQCRGVLEQQRKTFVLDTLLLLDDWQETLQTDPEAAVQKLGQIKQQYRQMLLADQVDIQAYIEIMELTLISLMTLTPRVSRVVESSRLVGEQLRPVVEQPRPVVE
jgi:uncharacterized protein